MNVHGVAVATETLDAAIAWIKRQPTFRASTLEVFLRSQGVPEWVTGRSRTLPVSKQKPVAHRVADRLIQKLRRDGMITLVRRAEWTGTQKLIETGGTFF